MFWERKARRCRHEPQTKWSHVAIAFVSCAQRTLRLLTLIDPGPFLFLSFSAFSKTYNAIPVSYVHVEPLEFARQQHAVVCDEVAHLLHFVHALFQPML